MPRRPPPVLTITVDGQTLTFQAVDLLDPALVAQLVSRITSSSATVTFSTWEVLASMPDDSRLAILDLVECAGDKARFRTTHGVDFTDPLQATLAQHPSPNDLGHVGRVVNFAGEVAGRFHPDVPRTAAQQIQQWMVMHRLPGERLDRLESRVRSHSQTAASTTGRLSPTTAAELVLGHHQEVRLNAGRRS